jgi:hypothetical protein
MSESLSYDNLVVGNQQPPVVLPATVRVYEAFSRGQIVGRLTATDKWQLVKFSDKANFNMFGIATEAVDTTAGTEALTDVFVRGEFSLNGVIPDYTDLATDWVDTLQTQGIFLRKTISVAGQ